MEGEGFLLLLFKELGPELRQSEDLLEINVVLRASTWPLVELVHELDVVCEVVDWLHLELSS